MTELQLGHLVEEGAAFEALTRERNESPERFEVVVIGGGQAGLAAGYHLAKTGVRFVILDAAHRTGDAWRNRWDSLRLFTPARYDSLDGMPFPAPPSYYPTKDEMADYLEAYAGRFALPVRHGVRVDRVSARDGGYLVEAGRRRFQADEVVVALGSYQRPVTPAFAGELDRSIVQLHSLDYRTSSQLEPGPVLLVGAGNSGADIAMELSRTHSVTLAGPDTGHVPFRIDGPMGRIMARVIIRFVFHHVLTIKTPMGRRRQRELRSHGAMPLIRVKPRDLAAAGVRRVGKVTGVVNGRPVLADGEVLDVANVIWCSGFRPGFSWLDLPVFAPDGEPRQVGGVATDVEGLYFIGLPFVYSVSSAMIHGVSRDAARIAATIAARRKETAPG
jgi:putative flavoprotein involved in K+ transport